MANAPCTNEPAYSLTTDLAALVPLADSAADSLRAEFYRFLQLIGEDAAPANLSPTSELDRSDADELSLTAWAEDLAAPNVRGTAAAAGVTAVLALPPLHLLTVAARWTDGVVRGRRSRIDPAGAITLHRLRRVGVAAASVLLALDEVERAGDAAAGLRRVVRRESPYRFGTIRSTSVIRAVHEVVAQVRGALHPDGPIYRGSFGYRRRVLDAVPRLASDRGTLLWTAACQAVLPLLPTAEESTDALRACFADAEAARASRAADRNDIGDAATSLTTRTGSWTKATANERAKELAALDESFGSASQRVWAERIGCSEGLVGQLPYRRECLERRRVRQQPRNKGPKALPLIESAVGVGGRDQVLADLIAEHEKDYEPSPFEDGPPHVYAAKRI